MLASEAHAAFESFPLAAVEDVFGAGRPLILAPHPDDESLGCGGLIAACCVASPALVPEVVIVTDGAASHEGSREFPPPRLRAIREREVGDAVRELGLPPERLSFLGLPDAGAPWQNSLVEAALAALESLLVRSACSTIVASWGSDPHCDHEGTQHLARRFARRHQLRLLSYPVWGWLLEPDAPVEETAMQGWRVDITAHRDAKRRAVAAHRSQHGGLIDDAAEGFSLPESLLSALDREYEVVFASR